MKSMFKMYLELPVFNAVVMVLMVVFGTVAVQKGCSTGEPEVVVQKTPPPDAILCDGGATPGSSRFLDCPSGLSGRILETCTEGGWQEADRSCSQVPNDCENQAADKVTFDKDIRPIVEQSCAGGSCHPAYTQFAVISTVMQPPNYELIGRINRDDQRRMPKPPAGSLGVQDKNLFQQWLSDGLIENEECSDDDPGGSSFILIDEDYIETRVEADLTRLPSRTRDQVTYLSLAHKYNQRVTQAEMNLHIDGMIKSLNSISRNENVAKPTPIDVRGTLWRVNLEDFDLDANARFGRKRLSNGQIVSRDFWDIVLDFEPFKLESFTTRGLNIKELSGRDITWLHADNFIFTTHDTPSVYYAALGVALNIDDFFRQIGVDLQESFDDFEITMAGGFGSPISLNKNRMLIRTKTERSVLAKQNGYMWFTQDPIDVDGVAERNLFQFPFPKEANSQLVFDFAAGEIIWTLPNGFQGYVLFNSAGLRQDEAPINVVIDTDSPFSPIIKDSISCYRCHVRGVIPMGDDVRASVLANASEFIKDDEDKVKAYFPVASALADTFNEDRQSYARAQGQIGLSVEGTDSLNFTTDNHRKDWTLLEFCSFIHKDLTECRQLLNGSAAVRAQIGQLLTGSSVSRNQVIQTFPQVIIDFGLGQEDIDQ